MKSEDPLVGIAARTNGKTTDCASTLKFSAFKADQQTFDAILGGLIEEFPAFWRGPREDDESEIHSLDCLFLMLIEQLKQNTKGLPTSGLRHRVPRLACWKSISTPVEGEVP